MVLDEKKLKTIYQTQQDLFNDGLIGDPVDVSSEVSFEPTVKPPVPEPVEFPIKRNDDLNRFKSGSYYNHIDKNPVFFDFEHVNVPHLRPFLFAFIC